MRYLRVGELNFTYIVLQICKVDPVMNSTKRMSGMKYAEESIRKYYRSNDVNKFVFSRPFHKEPKDPKKEFASLWLDRYTLWTAYSFPGIMSWFPVVRESSVQVNINISIFKYIGNWNLQ